MRDGKSVVGLSDNQLHQNLLALKSKESRIIALIVSHLEEVYRRRLFADYKCSSIYDYCIRILGYSNGEAHKKISACKLASHCEGIKESIANGELSLSNAASVQVFLNQSAHLLKKKKIENSIGQEIKKDVNATSTSAGINTYTSSSLDTKAIVERVKNKSTRECEVELEKIAYENHLQLPEKKPSKRNYGDKTLLKVYLDREKLQLLKSRLNIGCEQELLQILLEEKLAATEPNTEVKPKPRKASSQNPRSISPSKRAIILKRAQKKCENCGSKYYLEVDHKISVVKGGGNAIDNLRVLCRSCNQRAAIDQLGIGFMEKFMNKNSPPLSEGPFVSWS